MSKTKDNVEGQSKEELDSQKEVSDKSESADKPYVAFEQIKSLEDVIGRLHAEADFAAKAFGGNTGFTAYQGQTGNETFAIPWVIAVAIKFYQVQIHYHSDYRL